MQKQLELVLWGGTTNKGSPGFLHTHPMHDSLGSSRWHLGSWCVSECLVTWLGHRFPVPCVVQTVGTSSQPLAWCSSHFLAPRAQSAAALQLHTKLLNVLLNTVHRPAADGEYGSSWVTICSSKNSTWEISTFCKHLSQHTKKMIFAWFLCHP